MQQQTNTFCSTTYQCQGLSSITVMSHVWTLPSRSLRSAYVLRLKSVKQDSIKDIKGNEGTMVIREKSESISHLAVKTHIIIYQVLDTSITYTYYYTLRNFKNV